MANLSELMGNIGVAIDALGVLVIAGGVLVATARLVARRRAEQGNHYKRYRQDLGRSILLGLEFLIAERHHSDRRRGADAGERGDPRSDRSDSYLPQHDPTVGD